jgi:hypothetical protein
MISTPSIVGPAGSGKGEAKPDLISCTDLLDAVAREAEEINSIPESEGPLTPLEKFKRSLLKPGHEYPLPEPVMSLVCNNKSYALMTLKSLSLWQGKAKSRKTTVLALIVAAYISEIQSNDIIKLMPGIRGKVLFCDLEQGQGYAACTMKRILQIAELESSDRLLYSDLRTFTSEERLEIIEAALFSDPDIRLVIIDGYVDLLQDFMNAAEGQELITRMGSWASRFNVHIAGVLHQNKADKNARAHVGSIAVQKSEAEFMVEVDPKQRVRSIVHANATRGVPIKPFAIVWPIGSLPMIDQTLSDQPGEQEKHVELVDKIFDPAIGIRYGVSCEKIKAEAKCETTKAKEILKEMLRSGLVIKDGKLYRKSKSTQNSLGRGS